MMNDDIATLLFEPRSYGNNRNLAVPCMICDEMITLNLTDYYEVNVGIAPKICDKCKQAIMKMR